ISVDDLVPTLSDKSSQYGVPVSVTSVTDEGASVTTNLSYQWNLNGVAISGANGTSYAPKLTDVGGALSVTVSYKEAAGTESTTVSAGTVAPNTNTPIVVITSAAEGSNQAIQTIAGTVMAHGGGAVVGQTVTLTDNGLFLANTAVLANG